MYESLRDAINSKDSLARHLGITVEEMRKGYAKAILPHSESVCNGFGNLHGGASFTLADMAFAGVALADNIATVNISSSISFTAAGKQGPYTAIAKLISESRKLCTIEVLITDSEDNLIAVFTGTGYRMGKPYLDEA